MTVSVSPLQPIPVEPDEQVKTRLLRAAVQVFDRKGYAGASVREIADLAGVTKPALYYHFGSKEGVLLAILHEAQRQFADTVDRALARPGTARDRITALCEEVYGQFELNVPVVRVAHAVFLGPPEAVPNFDVSVFDTRFLDAVERIVAEGITAGELRDVPPRDVAMAVEGILQGSNERQLHPAFEKVGAEGVRRLIGLLFDGLTNAPRAQGASTQ